MVILYSSFNKSIKNGISTRIPWTHMSKKSESSKTSSQDWKSTTSIATTTWEPMSFPSLDPLEELFHRESLSMNFTIHQSRYQANKLLTRRLWPHSEKYL